MDDPLRDLRRAMDELARVEQERRQAWALAALLEPAAGREARMQAERGLTEAREALRHAKARVGLDLGDKAWSGH